MGAYPRDFGELAELVSHGLIFPGERSLRPVDVWDRAGVDETTARSLWRAMGFPEPPDEERAFTDADVEALKVAFRLRQVTGLGDAALLQQARVVSQAVARVAASHQDVLTEMLSTPDPGEAIADADAWAREALPALEHLLGYLYRRHLASVTEQRLLFDAQPGTGAVSVAVGFADVAGFTELSQELAMNELAVVIEKFNAATSDVIAGGGGRLVKTIGDEVMFSARTAADAAAIAVQLLEFGLPADAAGDVGGLRIGLALGAVILREGDVFGPPVNLASRLTGVARRNSVVVDDGLREALDGDHRFRFSALPPKRLKGIGPVRAWRLRDAKRAAASA